MEIALYHMERNSFLGDCLCVVAEPTEELRQSDFLQSASFLALICSHLDLSLMRTAKDLANKDLFSRDAPILLRMGSECMFGMYGDSHCDCESQRVASLREIRSSGQGVYLHLPQEAQGRGLLYKARELQLQVRGLSPSGDLVGPLDVAAASRFLLGSNAHLDRRGFASVQEFVRRLKLDRYNYTLITDSPRKLDSLAEVGLVGNASISPCREISIDNAGEYLAKVYQKNYRISNAELQDIYLTLASAGNLPARVRNLLDYLSEDLANGRQFDVDSGLLRRIVGLLDSGGYRPFLPERSRLDGADSYEEMQTEIKVSQDDVDVLFRSGLFSSIASLRYEENHYYDLATFEGVPARSLKVRYAYRLQDYERFDECKIIYKVPLGQDDAYRVHVSSVTDEEVVFILAKALRDVERHVLPVFTHNVVHNGDRRCTVLIKRYSQDLRVISVMGPSDSHNELVEAALGLIDGERIGDPSNVRYLDRTLSLGFDRKDLAEQEVQLYRSYALG